MSKHKISAALRHCLWLVHNSKCAYCDEPLSFGEMEADHIIPERYWDDSALPALLADLGLPSTFDLKSTSNLLPAHGRCNRRKADDVYKPAALHFYLQQAENKAPQVSELLKQQAKRSGREQLLSQVADALETGLITRMDIYKKSQNPDILKLTKPLLFSDGIEESVSPGQIEEFLDRPVLMGGNPIFSADFGDDTGSRMKVRTCREYRAALSAGFYARTTYDIKSTAFLQTVNAVLAAAETMKVPHLSYIVKPFRGLPDLGLIPVEALPQVSPDDPVRVAGMAGQSFQDLLERGEIKILKISSYELSIEWHWGLLMREVCRADLDGDGIEDILCECYCWAPEGTLGFGWTSVISRKASNAPFVIARL